MNTTISLVLIFGVGIVCLFIGLTVGANIANCPISIQEVEVPVKQDCPKVNVANECVNLLNDAETIKRLAEVKKK